MNRKIYAILMALVMLLTLPTIALATETETDGVPALLMQAQQQEGETVVTVFLQGCEGVTNGRILVSYDAQAVAFASATVSDAYAVSSINDQTAGTVALAWVGSHLTGETVPLLTLRFQIIEETFVSATYTAESDGIYADGEPVEVAEATLTTVQDTSALEKAIQEAEGLNKSLYTEQSFAAVENALREAKTVLADPEATQAELNAAAQMLNDAMAALVLLDENPPTLDNKAMVLAVFLVAASAVCFAALLKRYERRNHA